MCKTAKRICNSCNRKKNLWKSCGCCLWLFFMCFHSQESRQQQIVNNPRCWRLQRIGTIAAVEFEGKQNFWYFAWNFWQHDQSNFARLVQNVCIFTKKHHIYYIFPSQLTSRQNFCWYWLYLNVHICWYGLCDFCFYKYAGIATGLIMISTVTYMIALTVFQFKLCLLVLTVSWPWHRYVGIGSVFHRIIAYHNDVCDLYMKCRLSRLFSCFNCENQVFLTTQWLIHPASKSWWPIVWLSQFRTPVY